MSIQFPTATQARSQSNLLALHDDICMIQKAILMAIENGLREVTVCDTPIATDPQHYDAWQARMSQSQCNLIDDTTQQTLLDLQAEIIKCFTDLGYVVQRINNTMNPNGFCWKVTW